MNKNIYKVIFSTSLQQMVVVGEYAKRAGKNHHSFLSRGTSTAFRLHTLVTGILLAFYSIGQCGFAASVIMENMQAPPQLRPVVLRTDNGLPQIEIQTPNASGISMNEFSRFDVDNHGAILNNSRLGSTTQLGGQITGNPYLAKGEADLIVNQVRSQQHSNIGGIIEIAGKKADVIVANPAGLNVSGGFLNAGKVQYTAGDVSIAANRVTQHSSESGFINIAPGGLNAQNHDYTTFLARQVTLNDAIHAEGKDIDIITGVNTLDADGKIEAKTAGKPVDFAVDSSALGGMYANRIRLVGTEKGLGVHHRGTIRSERLSMDIPATLRNEGEITSAQMDVRLVQLENNGTLRHSGNGLFNIDAASISNTADALIKGKHLEQHAQSQTQDNTPAEPANHTGKITVSETILNAGNITSLGSLALKTADLDNRGLINVQKLDLRGGTLDNRHGIASFEEARIHAYRLDNQEGALYFGNADPIVVEETVNNAAGTIKSLGSLSIDARHIDNTRNGAISSKSALYLTAKESIINGGTISGERLHLEADTLINHTDGKIFQFGPYALNIDTKDYDTGNTPYDSIVRKQPPAPPSSATDALSSSPTQEGKLKIHSRFDNQGLFEINGQISVTASRSFTNHQDIELAGLSLHNGATLNNSGGTIRAPQILLNTNHIDNSGGQLKTNTLSLQSKSLDNRDGHIDIAAHGHIAISEEWQNQGGKVSSNNPLHISSRNTYNDRGEIQSASGINIVNSGLWDNGTGKLLAQQNLAISGGNLKNNGLIQAGNHLAYTNAQNIEQSGKLFANTGDITGNAFSNSGEIAFKEKAKIQTENTANRGQITSGTSIDLRSAEVANSGLLHARQALDLQTTSLQNAGNISSEQLEISAQKALDNRRGTLAGKQRISLNASEVQNRSGKIGSDNEISLTARQLGNQQGQIASKSKLFLHIDESVDNQGGELAAEEGWTLATQRLGNQQGHIFAGKALDIQTRELDNSGGIINAYTHTVNSAQIVNAGGKLLAQKELTIQTSGAQLDNRRGTLASRGDLNVAGDTEINSRGGRISAENIQLDVNKIRGGAWHSNRDINLNARAVSELDSIITGGNLGIYSLDPYSLDAPHYSVGESTIHTKGDLTIGSHGRIEAEGNLSLYSDILINEGVIKSAGRTKLLVDQSIENRNGSVIAGRHVAIGTENLLNTKTGGRIASSIVAVDRLDIGAKTIRNDNDAGLYSIRSLHIGGNLNDKNLAEGQTETLVNDNGGEIQANTLLSIAAQKIENLDTGHEIKDVIKESTLKSFYSNYRTDGWIGERGQSQNPDFNSYSYIYDEQKLETESVPHNPGKILSGAHIEFDSGTIRNHGLISAASIGGTADIDNDKRPGNRIIRAANGSVYRKNRDGDWDRDSEYTPPDIVTPITFEIGKTDDKPYTIGAPTPLPSGGRDRIITTIDADGKTVQWQTTEADYQPALPKNSLFTLNIANVDHQPNAQQEDNPAARLGLITLNPEIASIPGIPKDTTSGFTFVIPLPPEAEGQAPRVDHSQLVGDAHYLRELVNQEVLRRTGHRYLHGHSDDNKQFRDLYAHGQAFLDKHQIAPGVALTPEQMTRLTDDMVLMVNKTITLPDGRKVERLVPQLYTRVRPRDIAGQPVISANQVNLKGNTLANRAAISGRDTLDLRYDHIDQHGILASNHGKVFDFVTTTLIHSKKEINEKVLGAIQYINSIEDLGYNFHGMDSYANSVISSYQTAIQEGKSYDEAYRIATNTSTPGLTFAQTHEKVTGFVSSAAQTSATFAIDIAKFSLDFLILDDLKSIVNPQSPKEFFISAVSITPAGKSLKLLKAGSKADKANDIRKAVDNSQIARQSSNFSTHIGKEKAIQENIQKRIDNPDIGIEELMKNSVRRKDTKGRAIQFDRFEKGFNQANIDFEFLKPNNIRSFEKNGTTGRLGTLSDGRNINVRSKSSREGPPTIEVQNKNNQFKFRY